MIEKKRLLRQFALPTDQRQAFQAVWRRQQDLFGDCFELVAHIDAERIDMVYSHARPEQEPLVLWSLSITAGASGRAKIDQCLGIDPPVSTLQRASAIVAQAMRHMQANPLVTPHLPLRPTQSPKPCP